MFREKHTQQILAVDERPLHSALCQTKTVVASGVDHELNEFSPCVHDLDNAHPVVGNFSLHSLS